MKGKRFVIRVLVIIMIGAGFLSVMEVVAGELPKAPSLKVLRVSVGFHGDEKAEAQGEIFSYDVDPGTGCIQNFFDKDGQIPKTTEPPGWLVKGKEILYSGSFGDLQCRQGIIGIGSSPIEYWGWKNGSYICIIAWDPCNWRLYPRCRKPYIKCP